MDPQDPPTEPTVPPVAPTETPANEGPPAAPPPAAKVVIEGTKTERELALERDLKSREQRLAELEDENFRLKKVPTPPTPPAKEKKSWMSGWTFYDQED